MGKRSPRPVSLSRIVPSCLAARIRTEVTRVRRDIRLRLVTLTTPGNICWLSCASQPPIRPAVTAAVKPGALPGFMPPVTIFLTQNNGVRRRRSPVPGTNMTPPAGASITKAGIPTFMSTGKKPGHLSMGGTLFYMWGCQGDGASGRRKYSSACLYHYHESMKFWAAAQRIHDYFLGEAFQVPDVQHSALVSGCDAQPFVRIRMVRR